MGCNPVAITAEALLQMSIGKFAVLDMPSNQKELLIQAMQQKIDSRLPSQDGTALQYEHTNTLDSDIRGRLRSHIEFLNSIAPGDVFARR